MNGPAVGDIFSQNIQGRIWKILYLCTYTYTDMPTRTISISEEAYERLTRLKTNSKMSFSDVILKFTPPKRTLAEVLHEFGPNPELADAIERVSNDMRQSRMREVRFDADA
jgi:predicted CopG family antitoxin